MIRHDQMGLVTDPQIRRRHRDPARSQFIDLPEQHRGVQHHPISDDVHLPDPEDPHRQKMSRIFFRSDANGMSRVGPAAISHDDIRPFRQEIDDFPLPLIAPLQPDDARILLLQRNHSELPFRLLTINATDVRKVGRLAQGCQAMCSPTNFSPPLVLRGRARVGV